MYQIFWRNPALPLEPERESQKSKRLLFSQTHFTSGYSNMAVKSTKESTSQSFQRLGGRILDKIASDTDLFAKKVCAKKIFGSHLLLQNKKVHLAKGETEILAPNSLAKTGETAWACLRHAHTLASSEPISSVLVSLLYQVRTYFQNR